MIPLAKALIKNVHAPPTSFVVTSFWSTVRSFESASNLLCSLIPVTAKVLIAPAEIALTRTPATPRSRAK